MTRINKKVMEKFSMATELCPSRSQPHPATDNGVRDGRSILTDRPSPPLRGSAPSAPFDDL